MKSKIIKKRSSKGKSISGKIVPAKFDECGKRVFRNEKVCKYFLSDVLKIPVEKIKSIKYLDTHLLRRYHRQKSGILDILVELNDDTKINIELQLKIMKHWDKRQMFYLAKLYTEELMMGEKYEKLKRCIGISILDFNLTNREEYHNIYYFQNQEGNYFSKDLELHTIELKKKLKGEDTLDDWVRLFNAESEEELDMIKTNNIGIREAITEVKRYSLIGFIRELYEDYADYLRDKAAIEDYIKDEAREEGLAEGREQGREEGRAEGIRIMILDNLEEGKSKEQIISKLIKRFSLSSEEAEKYFKKYSIKNL